jgi:hypothetical protein
LNPGNNFRYVGIQSVPGGYGLALGTAGLRSGTYALRFSAGADPVVHEVRFSVK